MTNRELFGCVKCLSLKHECPDCVIARLARERDEARCQRYDLQQEVAALRARAIAAENEVAVARAHFRRACELLEKRAGVQTAEAWQRQIVAEEGDKP